jgi:methyl-accepting chemotaxis protein
LSNPIPHKTKVQVLHQWIQVIPRDRIAENNDIGRGTVSNIIKQFKTTVPDIDLMRETALQIKKEDLEIFTYAASIRLRRLLEQLNITEDQVENLLEEISIYCFKQQITSKDFVLKINEVSDLAMDLQTPIHKLPSFVNQLSSHKGKLEREIANKKQEYNQVIKENEKYVDELQEFRAKKHLLPKLNDLQQLLNSKINTLDLAIKESSDLAKENYQLKAILAKDDILPYEFTEANKKLDLSGDNKPLDKKEIAAIVYELYYYPSDHINIIKTMRQRIKQQQHEFEINNQ